MFIHFGLPHLVNNMVIFCCVGSRLERAAGHFKMFVIYMLSGIGGGLLSYFMMLYSRRLCSISRRIRCGVWHDWRFDLGSDKTSGQI